ncbi:MAG: hypothetical protein HJJLKODD_00646 [Phycisphaerae bacterium]|nr:hypothetical protein [Phycisphaerae bacterium]
MTPIKLEQVPGQYAVARSATREPWYFPADANSFFSLTRTADELSVVCSEEQLPAGVLAERGFCLFRVSGVLDFSLVGVVAGLTAALKAARISVLVIGTFDTDYLLVRENQRAAAVQAWNSAGYPVQ